LPPAPVVAKKGFPSRGVEKPGDVNHLAQSFGFVVPAGVVSTTGIAGLTLGGGTGYLTRKYGLTIDNLLGVDMVLADGSLLGNSEHQPIANLPVAHRFSVFLAACVHACRQPLAARRMFVSQQCDEL
jgi:hypothetical protein